MSLFGEDIDDLFLDGVVITTSLSAPVDWAELEESHAVDRACAAMSAGGDWDCWGSDDVHALLNWRLGRWDDWGLRVGVRLNRDEREEGQRPLDLVAGSGGRHCE